MSDFLGAPAVDLTGPLATMLRSVVLQGPKLLLFGAILLAGCLLAVGARVAVGGVLDRTGFNRAVDRGGLRRMLAASRYDPGDLVARLVYYALILITLQISFGVFGPNPVSTLISNVVAWLPKAAVAIVIVVVASAIAGAVRTVAAATLGGLAYGAAIAALASWFVMGLGVIAGLNQIGVATAVTTPVLIAVLATVGGILVVGVGGGLVRPMQRRWEGWLDRSAGDAQTVARRANAYAAGRTDLYRSRAAAPTATAPADAGPEPVFATAPTSSAPANWTDTPTGEFPRPTASGPAGQSPG